MFNFGYSKSGVISASAGYDSLNKHQDYMSRKESVMKCIEKKDKSAAAFFCNISREIPFQDPGSQLMKDIVGVVALIGTVHVCPLGRLSFAFYAYNP